MVFSNIIDEESMKTIVIVPAYNEAANIIDVISELTLNNENIDYVIIDDGSSDETRDVCKERKLNYISLPINLGIGGAVQAGYYFAYEMGYDIAIQLDGDGQHDPCYINSFVELIKSGNADMVIGSRYILKEGFQSSFMRRLGISILRWVIWVRSGCLIKDVTSGFRAVNRKLMKEFALCYPIDYPEPESLVFAYSSRKYVIKEIPVVMRERKSGKSSINPFKSVVYMIKVSLSILFCEYKRNRR